MPGDKESLSDLVYVQSDPGKKDACSYLHCGVAQAHIPLSDQPHQQAHQGLLSQFYQQG